MQFSDRSFKKNETTVGEALDASNSNELAFRTSSMLKRITDEKAHEVSKFLPATEECAHESSDSIKSDAENYHTYSESHPIASE